MWRFAGPDVIPLIVADHRSVSLADERGIPAESFVPAHITQGSKPAAAGSISWRRLRLMPMAGWSAGGAELSGRDGE